MGADSEEKADAVRIGADPLRDFCQAIFEGVGVPREDARLFADTLVAAELRGVESHGVMRVPHYVARLRGGGVRAVAEVRVVRDQPCVAVIDGCHSLGQVLSVRAMNLAMSKAAAHGIGAVAVRNSSHFGAAAYYAMMAPPRRMIGMAMTNASPVIAPWGGTRPLIGNNPWAVAVPANEEPPVVLDMAMTVAARGWIKLAAQEGRPIPSGWAIDAEGNPTTDPVAALKGLILPVGGYKGYGMALMFELLAGALSGASVLDDVQSMWSGDGPQGLGHVFIALHVGHFTDPADFADRVDGIVRRVRSQPRAPGVERIYVPGEIEHLRMQRNLAGGIPLRASTAAALVACAAELGVPAPAALADAAERSRRGG